MCYTQLRAVLMISKNRRERPYRETERQTYRRMDRWTYNLNWNPLGSFVSQCKDNNKYIATRWTPTLEINTSTKSKNSHGRPAGRTDGRIDGWTDGKSYYTATQGICICGLRSHALREITGLTNDLQKSMRMNGQRDIRMDGQTDG